MSELFLCGDCGFLGEVSALARKVYEKGKDKLDLSVIIEKNGFACKCCPVCQSTTIYYKLPFLGSVSVPRVWRSPPLKEDTLIRKVTTNVPEDEGIIWHNVENKPQPVEDDIINEDILIEALESTSKVEVSEKPSKKAKKEKISINRTHNSKTRFKCSCDGCKKPFESKIEGTTKCPECIKAMIG